MQSTVFFKKVVNDTLTGMLTTVQALLLGGFQGISELFPISSLAHTLVLPALLGWRIDEQSNFFLQFLVVTHLATATVLLLYYGREWLAIAKGIFVSLHNREIATDNASGKLGWLLVVSTIPAGLIGLLFEEQIRALFISPLSAAAFLIANGVILFFAEWLKRRRNHETTTPESQTNYQTAHARIAQLTWSKGLIVGSLQALALIPGFSRTGASLSGSLLVGLSHEDALRFSFLLATPVIGAAAALKIPELFAAGNTAQITMSLVGAAASAVFAYISVRILSKYFKVDELTLTPFGIYCIAAGIISLALLSSF